jgi:hypothetical protein
MFNHKSVFFGYLRILKNINATAIAATAPPIPIAM